MRKTAPKIENDESNEALKALTSEVKYQERRLTIMGVILVVIFVGCNSFYMIYYIMEGLDLKNNVLLWRANDLYIHSTARVFAIINSSVNVFIYGAFNKKFKELYNLKSNPLRDFQITKPALKKDNEGGYYLIALNKFIQNNKNPE